MDQQQSTITDQLTLRDTWYEIRLDDVAWNCQQVLSFLSRMAKEARKDQPPILAPVLKANGYGMGAVQIAQVCIDQGIELLAVATLSEALELRNAFPDQRIMIMGYTSDRLLKHVIEHHIEPTLFEYEQAKLLSSLWSQGSQHQTKADVHIHIKIETGLNRLGCDPGKRGQDQVRLIAQLPGLRIASGFSHLALTNQESDWQQYRKLVTFVEALRTSGTQIPLVHLADSIGMVRYPEFHLDMVRPGAILYGAPPLGAPYNLDIRVPFALKTRITRVRRLAPGEGVGYDFTWKAPAAGAIVATIPIGYADGYCRSFSNKAQVMIRHQRAPVVGLVNMDQAMVDVSGIPDVQSNDEVLLLGKSETDEIPLLDAAKWANTNRNEILAGIGRRVPRVYITNGQISQVVSYV